MPLLCAFALLAPLTPAVAQDGLDRADPARAERELPERELGKAKRQAQTDIAAPAGETAIGSAVRAQTIAIEGLGVLARADFDPIVAPYIGRRLDRDELIALAGAIASGARARGLPFATAWIPAQKMTGGVLTVMLDEGKLDEVRMTGEPAPGAVALLAPLADGRAVAIGELERRLLLAGDIPGLSLTTRYIRENGRGVLVVHVRRDAISGRASIDNYAPASIGPVRVRASVDFNQVLAQDDRLSIEGVVAPSRGPEFALIAVGYDKRLAIGTRAEASAYYARSSPGGALRLRNTEGESHKTTLRVTHALVRSRRATLWLGGAVAHRESRQQQEGARVREDKTTLAELELRGFVDVVGGTLHGRLTATRGLDLLDATRRGDAFASRRDGDGVFTKLEAAFAWTGTVAGPVSIRLAGEGQIASRPLLSSEEFAIGGPRFLRGYDYSERQGDKGVAGLAELRFDLGRVAKSVRSAQVYGFVDGGIARNLGTGSGGGSLASAGAGLRTRLKDGFSAGVELAVPLTGLRFDSGDRSPQISFELRKTF